jgi:hypothetical protein
LQVLGDIFPVIHQQTLQPVWHHDSHSTLGLESLLLDVVSLLKHWVRLDDVFLRAQTLAN